MHQETHKRLIETHSSGAAPPCWGAQTSQVRPKTLRDAARIVPKTASRGLQDFQRPQTTPNYPYLLGPGQKRNRNVRPLGAIVGFGGSWGLSWAILGVLPPPSMTFWFKILFKKYRISCPWPPGPPWPLGAPKNSRFVMLRHSDLKCYDILI